MIGTVTILPSQPVSVGTLASRPTPSPQSASTNQAQTTPTNSNSNPAPTSTKAPGVVSYAVPTPKSSLPINTPSASSEIPAVVPTSSPAAVSEAVIHSAVIVSYTTAATEVPLTLTIPASHTLIPTNTIADPSSSFDPAQPSSSLVIVSMVAPSDPHSTATFKPLPSNPVVAFRHTPAFILVILLSLLVVLGTLFASLSWLIRRTNRRRNDDDAWIGEVLSDEPDDSTGDKDEFGETVGRYTNEMERGYGEEPRLPGLRSGDDSGEGGGRAGVGTRWNTHNEGRAPAGYGPGSTAYGTETFGATPGPASGFTSSAPNGFTPTPNPNSFTRSRHSILQRGAPPPSCEYGYGLDGGGLTFRRDAVGVRAYTTTEDIVAPDSHSYPNPHDDANATLQRPIPALATSPSHYSLTFDSTRPLAVTNLMPGDISGRTSFTSLALNLGAGSGSNSSLSSSGRARSLGLPTGRLDDPNPWKRYEGVEGRGGGGVVPASVERQQLDENGGRNSWSASIRLGFYSAVGRIVGSAAPGEEKLHSGRGTPISSRDMVRPASTSSTSSKSTTDEKPKPESLDWRSWLEDRPPTHSMVPDERGWIVEEETADGARGKIHIVAGGRDRLIRRLNPGSGDAASFTSSPMTVYSSDNYSSEGPVLSSVATTRANTFATSRRDTVSTRRTECRRAYGRERDKDTENEDEGDGGASRMKCRELSAASSDWGSENLARALGMSMGRPVRDLERPGL